MRNPEQQGFVPAEFAGRANIEKKRAVPKKEKSEAKEVLSTSDNSAERKAFHDSLKVYMFERLLSQRKNLHGINKLREKENLSDEERGKLYAGLITVSGEVLEVANTLHDIEWVIANQEDEGIWEPESILKQVPEKLIPSLQKLLQKYKEQTILVQEVIDKHSAEDIYEGIIGAKPVGNITQERRFNTIVWRFDNEQDQINYYVGERVNNGMDPKTAKKKALNIAAEVSGHTFDNKKVRIVTYEANPDDSIVEHEESHAKYAVSSLEHYDAHVNERQAVRKEFGLVQFRKECFNDMTDSFKDEALAYLREGLSDPDRYANLGSLVEFGKPSYIYDYPNSYKDYYQSNYEEHFGTTRGFEHNYNQATAQYRKFAKDLVDQLREVFWDKNVEIDETDRHPHSIILLGEAEEYEVLRFLEMLPASRWAEYLEFFNDIASTDELPLDDIMNTLAYGNRPREVSELSDFQNHLFYALHRIDQGEDYFSHIGGNFEIQLQDAQKAIESIQNRNDFLIKLREYDSIFDRSEESILDEEFEVLSKSENILYDKYEKFDDLDYSNATRAMLVIKTITELQDDQDLQQAYEEFVKSQKKEVKSFIAFVKKYGLENYLPAHYKKYE